MSFAVPEAAITFECGDDRLVGILHRPDQATAADADKLGIVVVVGGPQYRAGSHRQFVQLARRLASDGHVVLRFDVRGMGDSTGSLRHFEAISDDIGAAVDALQRHAPEVRRVVLWGLCDGASAALLYLSDRADERIAGVCLLNPWVRSPEGQARMHVRHYYLDRLRDRSFWLKLLSGRVAAGALAEFRANLRLARSATQSAKGAGRFQERMASALSQPDQAALIVLSGNDYTAKEFIEYTRQSDLWTQTLARVQRCDIPEADHTFSGASSRHQMEQRVCDWLGRIRDAVHS